MSACARVPALGALRVDRQEPAPTRSPTPGRTTALPRLRARWRGGLDDTGRELHRVLVRGQLTFLAVPALSRALGQVPPGSRVVLELDGSFVDHAAYETWWDWRNAHTTHGGEVELTGWPGARIAEPDTTHHRPPWTP